MFSWLWNGTRPQLLLRASFLVAAIALLDWRVQANLAFGFLYLFPLFILAQRFSRWQLALAALGCTALGERFGPFHWDLARDALIFSTYLGTAFFANETARGRREAIRHMAAVEYEVALRRESELQLEALIESSPAAILVLDARGAVRTANDAAHSLFGCEPHALPGASILDFLPAFAQVASSGDIAPHGFRTVMRCRGRRRNGEVFLADAWFSTFALGAGTRIAAMLVDVSEELRDREEFSLRQLLAGSRLIVGAVSHEVRNLCGAIAVVAANLGRRPEVAQSEDFKALGRLVEGLGKISALELHQSAADRGAAPVDLRALFDDLRVVIEPPLHEAGIAIAWRLPAALPPVWADPHILLQILLNLIKNSQRAAQSQPRPEISVAALPAGDRIHLRVCDNGSGIAAPDRLFEPFQAGAEATGMGLFLSRAFARSFDADLRCEPRSPGCCFVLDLAACPPASPKAASHGNG